MQKRQITIDNMTPEERKALDVKAGKALIVTLILFIAILGMVLFKFHVQRVQQSAGYGNRPPAPNSDGPRQDFERGEGLDLKVLEDMLRIGDFKKAEQSLLAILKKDSGSFLANVQLGLVYYRMGEMEKSIRYMEKARKTNSRDLFCLQTLGETYTLVDPAKALEFFYKNMKYQMERKDLTVGAVRAHHKYAILYAKTPEEKNKHLVTAERLLRGCVVISDNHIPRSYIDFLNGENALLQGKYVMAQNNLSRISLDTNVGNINEKVQAATELAMVYLFMGKVHNAYTYLDSSLTMMERWMELVPTKRLPREEQLAFIIHTLYNKPQLDLRLKSIARKKLPIMKLNVKPMGSYDKIGKLLFELADREQAKNYRGAMETARSIIQMLDDNKKGYFFDLVILKPLMKGSLLIFIGDQYYKTGDKESALDYYDKAIKATRAVERMAQARVTLVKSGKPIAPVSPEALPVSENPDKLAPPVEPVH